MKRIIAYFLAGVVWWLAVAPVGAVDEVKVYFFYSNSCPHCAKEEEFLDRLEGEITGVYVNRYEVHENWENANLLAHIGQSMHMDTSGVPILIAGRQYIVGYLSDETTGVQIRELIEAVRAAGDPDAVGQVIEGIGGQASELTDRPAPVETGAGEKEELKAKPWAQGKAIEELTLPVWGSIRVADWSLPALTVVIALLDGFNPCAMWVLLFLISMLLGMHDKAKMWSLGMAFIATSAGMYFLFMSAWLNLFLFVGLVGWIRWLVGVFAVGAGVWQVRSFFTDKQGGCQVTNSGTRRKIMEGIKKLTTEKHFWLALLGVMVLAVAVNLIELVCSAGLPAIYTQVLALSELSVWQYYVYLGLYVLVFMLDDVLVFGVAMTSLRAVGIESKYARYSHLIGGGVILVLGVLLLLKPEWLMFG